MTKESSSQKSSNRPWGIIIGVLMGAFTTLICVARGMEPMVVLERVGIASMVAGIVGGLGVRTINAIVPPLRSSRRRGQSRS